MKAPIATCPPNEHTLTDYDRQHLITYLRLLDAETDQANWRDAARLVLGADPVGDEANARATWESHLARAKWMAREGYRHLLAG